MRNKKIEDQLLKDILDLTLSFQVEFPSIYDSLLETPLFISYDQKEISTTELEAYSQFLKTQLRVFVKNKMK